MHRLTRKTHFLHTAWTALWNLTYYENPAGRRSREQRVSVLDLHADKVYSSRLADIHFELDLGVAVMTIDKAREMFDRDAIGRLDAYVPRPAHGATRQSTCRSRTCFPRPRKGLGTGKLAVSCALSASTRQTSGLPSPSSLRFNGFDRWSRREARRFPGGCASLALRRLALDGPVRA